MNSRKPILYAVLLLALNWSATADDDEVQVRIRDERVAPGGVVQMKVERYEVTPISGGRPKFSFNAGFFDDVVGIGMFAPTGELAGAALIDGDNVQISYVTTKTAPGDLPLLTVSLRVRKDAAPGSSTSFTLDPSSTWTLNGETIGTRVEAGEVTVGGSLSVSSVSPGQGVFPAGTLVTVRGLGFNRETRLRVEDVEITGVRTVSSTEMQFKLTEPANMTGKRLRLDNRDGSRVFYYSYSHGTPAATSTRPLLASTVPIFSGRTRTVSKFGPLPVMTASQYAAVALMNPGAAAADVTIGVYLSDGTLWDWSSLSLGAGQRLSLELSELLHSATPKGARIRVTSSRPIHAFRLLCDEGAWTATPALPL